MKELKLRVHTVQSSRGRYKGVKSLILFLIVFALGIYVGRYSVQIDQQSMSDNESSNVIAGSQFGIESNEERGDKSALKELSEELAEEPSMEIAKETPAELKAASPSLRIATSNNVAAKANNKPRFKAPSPTGDSKAHEAKKTLSPVKTPGTQTLKSLSYTVQVSAFRLGDFAQNHVDELVNDGYDAYLVSSTNSSGDQWHFVKIGKFDSFEEANDFATIFQQTESLSAQVQEVGGRIIYSSSEVR